MIDEAGCQADLGKGYSLGSGTTGSAADGSGGVKMSMEEARKARLDRLQQSIDASAAAAKAQAAATSEETEDTKPAAETDVEMDTTTDSTPEDTTNNNEASESKDVQMEQADVTTEEKEQEPEMVDPTEALSKEDLTTLTESMGFTLLRAQKGLLNGNGGVEGAVDWLMTHQDDADIDDPIPLQPKASPAGGQVAKSYKCVTTGKIFSSMANLELHAARTGYSNFEECTEEVKPLTPEEKAAKIDELKALLKAKRMEREEAEKVDNVDREKQRRFMGQEMGKTREAMEIEKRKRDASQRKKAKQDVKRERERIRLELEKDKRERMANKGKLTSKLGIDGYNPDAIQYDDPNAKIELDEAAAAASSVTTAAKPKARASVAKIDEYIAKISAYRAGGDGGKCLKVLIAYIKNIVENPTEEKFRTIKTDNKVYKAKVKPLLGSKALLLAVGFNPDKSGDCLVLTDEPDMDVLKQTKEKLETAFSAY